MTAAAAVLRFFYDCIWLIVESRWWRKLCFVSPFYLVRSLLCILVCFVSMLFYLPQYYLAQNTYASQLNCGIQLVMVSVPQTQFTWLKVRRDECYPNMYVIAKIRCWFFLLFIVYSSVYMYSNFFSKFNLGQYFNPHNYISGVVWCDMKTWKKNTNFDDPRNWNTGGVKCSNDIKKFPKDMRASVFIQKNESLQELVSYQLFWIVYIRARGRVFIPL